MDEIIKKYSEDKYLTEKEIKYRVKDKNNVEKVINYRKNNSFEIPLVGKNDKKLKFVLLESIKEKINSLEILLKQSFLKNIKKDLLEKIKKEVEISEGFNSSVIEGAFSTKKRIKELLNSKEEGKNRSEKMILNNYNIMSIINEIDFVLNNETVIMIHQNITKNTLEDKNDEGNLRNDNVYVYNYLNEVVYSAPKENKIQPMLNDLYKFIDSSIISSLLIGIILHYYILYIHPFFDGNGRTARSISYFYLLNRGYTFLRFFSISDMILKERNNYYKSIQDTYNEENDITYFIVFILDMLNRSIVDVKEKYINEYSKHMVIYFIKINNININIRQKLEINKLFRRKNRDLTIENYIKSAKVSQETARKDLDDLVNKGLLFKRKEGKKFVYDFSREIFDN